MRRGDAECEVKVSIIERLENDKQNKMGKWGILIMGFIRNGKDWNFDLSFYSLLLSGVGSMAEVGCSFPRLAHELWKAPGEQSLAGALRAPGGQVERKVVSMSGGRYLRYLRNVSRLVGRPITVSYCKLGNASIC